MSSPANHHRLDETTQGGGVAVKRSVTSLISNGKNLLVGVTGCNFVYGIRPGPREKKSEIGKREVGSRSSCCVPSTICSNNVVIDMKWFSIWIYGSLLNDLTLATLPAYMWIFSHINNYSRLSTHARRSSSGLLNRPSSRRKSNAFQLITLVRYVPFLKRTNSGTQRQNLRALWVVDLSNLQRLAFYRRYLGLAIPA
jgi:hypothetical protein